MNEDEAPRRKVVFEAGMPLDGLSMDELNELVALLETERERVRGALAARQSSLSAASAVFKR